MKKRLSRGKKWLLAGFIIALVIAGYTAWALTRPLGGISANTIMPPAQATASNIVWPTTGQAAVGIVGSSILQSNGDQTPVPTASTAKLITALTVLQAKPLKPGEQGPLLSLSANDAALFDTYSAQGGSVVPVQAGEQISEYQVLEAMMLPSANNLADSLAIWAFGSLTAYRGAADTFLAQHQLINTHIGSDASGFDPATTSTAHDLVVIGELAMQDPVLAQIVGQTSAIGIPVAGTIKNVNFLLGSHNIIGIKTGNSDQAGGAYVSASSTVVDGRTMTIVTALLKAPSLFAALNDSLPLIQSAQSNFHVATLVSRGSVVGTYHTAWDQIIPAVASQQLQTAVWGGTTVRAQVSLNRLTAQDTNPVVGSVSNPAAHTVVAVKLQRPVSKPTVWWRLLHPLH